MYTSANNPPLVCNGKYAKKNLRSLVVSGWCDISLDILKELEVLRVLILDSAHTSLLPVFSENVTSAILGDEELRTQLFFAAITG